MRLLVERAKSFQDDLTVIFVDFSKAFDSIDRSVIKKVLKLYKLPEKIVKVIMNLYTNTSATVKTPSGETEEFSTSTGVLQGDTLSRCTVGISKRRRVLCSAKMGRHEDPHNARESEARNPGIRGRSGTFSGLSR